MGCARLGVLWAGGGRWMGGQSKINFAWKRGLSSVYMLLWTDEGGGRSTKNLGHELCGLIHDDVRRRVISVTLPCWCACTSSVDRVRIRKPPRAERKRGRGKGKRANPFRIGAVAFDIERTQNCSLRVRRCRLVTRTPSLDRALATPKRTHASFASPRLAYAVRRASSSVNRLFEFTRP